MSVSSNKNGNVLVVIPRERFDTNTVPDADKLIADSIESGESRIVIDFSQTNYMSSAGLRLILKTVKAMHQREDGAFALCGANEQIHEVLEISGFLSMINAFPTLDEALKEVG